MKTTKSKLEQATREKAVENKFETLCNIVKSQQINWSNCLTNILNLKDELLVHSMPPALMLKLTVAHSELFRSQMDLIAPVQELVRLVTVYKQSLEDKSIALKRIDAENERRRVELDIAVRKLEQSYSYEKQWRRDHTLNNWERLFCKAALNRTHGRRWKFVISKVKQRAALGLSVFNPLVDNMSGDEEFDTARILAPRFTYGSTTNSSPGLTKQSGLSSHYTTSVLSTKHSTRQSSLMSSSLKMDTSGETEDEESEPLPTKHIRSPTIYKSPASVKKKVQTIDTSVSTEDWEYDTLLNIQVYNPIGLKLPYIDISCQLSLLGLTRDCDIIDATDESNYEELQFLFESEAHKRLGFKRGTSLGALLEEEISDQLEITIHSGMERKVFAICTIPIEDLSDSQPEINLKINPDDIVPKPFPMYALEGDVTAPCGYLPIFCVWKLTKREKVATVATNTDETQVDDDENMLIDELSCTKVSSSSPALSRKSVSVMIPTPKPSSEPTTPEPIMNEPLVDRTQEAMKRDEVVILTEACEIARTQAQEMAITHAQELERLQYEYELRLEGMAKALEMLKMERAEQQEADYSQTPISLVSCFTPATRPSSTSEVMQNTDIPSITIEQRAVTTASMSDSRKKKHRCKNNLPQDFFERMEYFTKSSLTRHHQLICRVKDEVQAHTESAMATQHRLSKRTPASDSPDSGINEATQDLSLPAIFMPNKTGVVFSPKAGRYFHPPGSKEPRLSQAPSVFQLPHMKHAPVLNLFDLSQKKVVEHGPGWLYKTCKDVTKR